MKYRDHYPANDQTRPAMKDAYVDTRELYVKIFGEPDEKIWPLNLNKQNTCGDSYSGFIPTDSEKSH